MDWEKYETKKAIFFADKIVLKKKKKNIVIERREIEKLCYARPTLLNYLLAGVHQLLPGQLAIWPKRPLKEGKKRDMYCGSGMSITFIFRTACNC